MATIKQKIAFDNVVENGGNVSRAMIDAHYSPATAKTPQKLTESKGWQELIVTFLDDEKLAKKHDQLLNATALERMSFDEETSDEVIEEVIGKMSGYELLHIVENKGTNGAVLSKYAYVKAPDNVAQDKALDKAYKIKGTYAPDKSVNVTMNVTADEKTLSIAKRYEEEIKQGL